MNKDKIKEEVINIIVEILCVDKSEIKEEMNLTKDLGADSLDAVEVIMRCEKVFDIAIPDIDAEKVLTIGDMINLCIKYIEDKK